jgi:hypothetical protein
MEINEFKTGNKIVVATPKELKEILKFCNPSMMRHYKQQLPELEIKGFGLTIEIKRK